MNIQRIRGFGAATLGSMALSGLLAATLLCGTTALARADAGDSDTLDLSDLERVTDDSLRVLRGGFRVGDVDLSFGVTMSTSVNGQQVLQTVFNPGDSPIANSAISADQRTTINHEIGQSITTNIANSADNRLIQNTTTVDVFFNNLPQVQAQAASSHALTTMIGDMNSHIVMGN
jgi:hypothetical protein